MCGRNVEEGSLTDDSTSRDYMCFVDKLPCVVGEDKTYKNLIRSAADFQFEQGYMIVNIISLRKFNSPCWHAGCRPGGC